MFPRDINAFLKLSKLALNKPFLSRIGALRSKATNIPGKKLQFEKTSNSLDAAETKGVPYERHWKTNVHALGNLTQVGETEHFPDNSNDNSLATVLEKHSDKRRPSNGAFKNLLSGLGESKSKPVDTKRSVPDLDWKARDGWNVPDEQKKDDPFVESKSKPVDTKRSVPDLDWKARDRWNAPDEQKNDDPLGDPDLPRSVQIYYNIVRNEVLKNGECDWKNISSLFDEEVPSLLGNWTTRLMQTLSHLEIPQPEKVLSLMEYIRATGTPSIADISFLVRTLGKEGFDSKYQETIWKLYDELKTMTDTFETHSGIAVIYGMSKTTRWKECLGILTDIEMICSTVDGHTLVAESAFHYGDHKTGFRLMEKLENERIERFGDKAYLKILEKEKEGDSNGQMENLLNFMNDNNVIPSEQVADGIADFILRYNSWVGLMAGVGKGQPTTSGPEDRCTTHSSRSWFNSMFREGNYTKEKTRITEDGKCAHCGSNVKKAIELTSVEFEELREAYKERVFVKGDIFLGSHPSEIEIFFRFLSRAPPVDLVIDGLNFGSAFDARGQRTDARIKALRVLKGVEYFRKRGLNVMVITKNHSFKGKYGSIWSQIKKISSVFGVDNRSKDDPFMIYAALFNGPRTCIVTRDELRNHYCLMEDMKFLFRRWQRQHQIHPLDIRRVGKNLQFTFQNPLKYEVRIQEDEDGCWHIPYDDRSDRRSYQLPNSWLCVRKC